MSEKSIYLQLLGFFLFKFICMCVCVQEWVCWSRPVPFLRAECTRCTWQFSGRTTWGECWSTWFFLLFTVTYLIHLDSSAPLTPPAGLRSTTARRSWAQWWAADPPAPCWPARSSSPCTTAPCAMASKIGWSSSRVIPSTTNGRWGWFPLPFPNSLEEINK